MKRPQLAGVLLVLTILDMECASRTRADDHPSMAIEDALRRAGENRAQLEMALSRVSAENRDGMRFLVANMPDHDLRSLSADFLVEDCEMAYRSWREAPWKDTVPREIFLNNILPYANINERRDAWRKDLSERFRPLVADAKTPSAAAAILNQKIFGMVGVKYSTARRKADQSPHESMQSGLASCSGLAVLLIDACRAVGIPARFAGTPLWADKSGNHSWVEVWDGGWHFTGAAEPTGDNLDQAWFIGRASTAQREHRLHAIYAVSFQRTPITFPLVWDRSIDYVYAVNVTDRYVGRAEPLADGIARVMLRVVQRQDGPRCSARLRISDAGGKIVFEGESKDERFDANDHVTVPLRIGDEYRIEAQLGDRQQTELLKVLPEAPLLTIHLPPEKSSVGRPEEKEESDSIQLLKQYLDAEPAERPQLSEQPFARQPLTRSAAQAAETLLWEYHVRRIRQERAAEMERRVIKLGDLEMPFAYRVFGDAPTDGRSLYISMHGGGGAPARVNDRQWENQKRLYELAEGIYLAPRAPTNTWDLWHQAHIDRFFDRLIENLIVFENVDSNRVYLMGYSAGGDGVYQVAPRMADRWAAAAMMAGHPNEASPLGLRNLPFTIHAGGKDSAYDRNVVAQQWGDKLAALRESDPQGYEYWLKVYPEKGHWLDHEDAASIPWMAKFTRTPLPTRIVWWQDDVTEPRFYWLAVPDSDRKVGTRITATLSGPKVVLEAQGVSRLSIRWNDQMADLDQPITVESGENVVFEGRVVRTIEMIDRTFRERGDPKSVFSGEVEVRLQNGE